VETREIVSRSTSLPLSLSPLSLSISCSILSLGLFLHLVYLTLVSLSPLSRSPLSLSPCLFHPYLSHCLSHPSPLSLSHPRLVPFVSLPHLLHPCHAHLVHLALVSLTLVSFLLSLSLSPLSPLVSPDFLQQVHPEAIHHHQAQVQGRGQGVRGVLPSGPAGWKQGGECQGWTSGSHRGVCVPVGTTRTRHWSPSNATGDRVRDTE